MTWLPTFLEDFANVFRDIYAFMIMPLDVLGGLSPLAILTGGLVLFLGGSLALRIIRG